MKRVGKREDGRKKIEQVHKERREGEGWREERG